MANLSVGQRVLACHSDGTLSYDDVIAFIHRQPQLMASFIAIDTVGGHRLVATGDHLVFATDDQSASFTTEVVPPTFAAHLRPRNDSVYVASPGSTHLAVSMVTNVTMVTGQGVFAPLTSAGTIVVGGVAASCYAYVSSHDLAHFTMAPLRLSARTCSRWKCHDDTLSPLDGVHWYARLLRRIAEFFVPAHSDFWFARY